MRTGGPIVGKEGFTDPYGGRKSDIILRFQGRYREDV